VNEANLAATELKRDIKFNTKMVKKLDPFGGSKNSKTEVLVKIDNNESKYYYEWPIDKFENRLFMIRELLEEFFDTGDLPRLAVEEDPFWDPPNPILIGQSFLSLESLSLMFENGLDAAILSISGEGGKQGILQVEYKPCDKNGNCDEDAIPEELIVENSEELVGAKDIYFKVFVKGATGLPKNLNCNPFVTYQFRYENSLFTTEEIPGVNSNPRWNYEQVHKIDYVDERMVEELKTGSISFMVYAYPPARAKLAQNDGGAAAMKRRATKIGGDFDLDPNKAAKILNGNDDSFASDASEVDPALIVG
jgi:kinesin family member 1